MNIKHETTKQVIKAAPAIGGSIYSAITLNDVVAIVTILYVLLQAGFLLYKWYWVHKENKNK